MEKANLGEYPAVSQTLLPTKCFDKLNFKSPVLHSAST